MAAKPKQDQKLDVEGGAPPAFVPSVTVRAMQPLRWRIGRQFTPEAVSIPAADLTEAEIEALKRDPLLSVVVAMADAD